MSRSAHTALAACARLGSWFDVPVVGTDDGWGAPEALLDHLPVLVERTRAALGAQQGLAPPEIDARVAASTLHLALLGRLLSPVVGVAVLDGTVLAMDRISAWRDTDRHVPDLGVVAAEGVACRDATSVGRAFAQHVLPLVDDLGSALDEAVGLSPQVLRSNVASALHGATVVMASADPSCADVAEATITAILHVPGLEDAWTRDAGRFRRRGCCLYYRLPRGGLCGDCVLDVRT